MNTLADIRPGQVLGRYEFLAPIAQGGMASVWAARQRGSRGFSKIVAIKTMLPSISDDPRFERMFLDEARIASRIRHHHVVEILDLGEQDSLLYLVMEWVDGESLSAIRSAAGAHGGIPMPVAVRLIADACAGLHAAHELCDDDGASLGIVHRDVSPQNILVGYDGIVRVLDFGVAKVAGRTSDTTSIGHARGKPPYMAPEQAMGHAIDRRADIFSLGIVLYQLIAERHPFRGENDIATLHNIVSDSPIVSPKAIVPAISDELEHIMLRAIDRNPERRFSSARELALALESVLDSFPTRVRSEDIGRMITTWLGARGEDRRYALREAIRRADAVELTQTDVGGGLEGAESAIHPTPVSRPQASVRRAATGETPARASSHQTLGAEVRSSTGSQSHALLDEGATIVDDRPAILFEGDFLPPLAAATGPAEGGGRFSRRVTGAIVLLAMLLGALLAWGASAYLRARPSRGSAAPTPADYSKPFASTAPALPPADASVDSKPIRLPPASNDADSRGANAAGGTANSTSTAVPSQRLKGRTAVKKVQATGPEYKLPPVPNPGF